VEPPKLDIYDFKGIIKSEAQREILTLENTVWANTYIAAGSVTGVVVFTGRETRSAMNSREARYKMGRLDKELNFLSKVLFLFMCVLAVVIVLVS
jgi:phospholipid-translocating ATPase